ncbi:ORF6C domain-containing protein [Clostridium butyricum]|uniref:ORF6C domain-containing protein n=1 Tax=Clostridium butyricum TaxID=1492 RepID=UPI002AAF4347|nr:ORF6C domain-containing protein [Clostridium butyricum]
MDNKFLEVSQIKLRGAKEVEGMKFHEIEGGFGKDKKAMLVKEIANIHFRELGKINELINNNRMRFNDGVDIVDSKGTEFEILLKDNGIYTQNALNVSKNIYLLSERGYSKLLKIMDDDLAWEKYDELVDGYFNMRAEKKQQFNCIEDIMIAQLKDMKALKGKVQAVEKTTKETKEEVKGIKDRMTIETGLQKVLCDLVNNKVITILGGKESPAYKELGKKAFRQCWKDYKNKLGVASYKDTPLKDFELGKKVIIDWNPNRELELMIKGCNAQLRM